MRRSALQSFAATVVCCLLAQPAIADNCDGTPESAISDPGAVEAAAKAGDAAAQAVIGKRYLQGEGVDKSEDTAVAWLKKSVVAGNREGQYLLGEYYDDQGKSPNDLSNAAKLYRKAADQGCTAAVMRLGALVFTGRGVPKNEGEGFKLIAQAAELGYTPAQAMTGSLLITGQGTKQDAAAGFKWIKQAADKGDSASGILLATLYLEGKGTPPDAQMARAVLKSIYRKGDSLAATAAYSLGWMYMEGKGVQRNDTEAFRWMIVAANAGANDSVQRLKTLEQRMPKARMAKECDIRTEPQLLTERRGRTRVGELVIVLAQPSGAVEVFFPDRSLVAYVSPECVAR